MQAIAVGCDYDKNNPISVDTANRIWSVVMANSAADDAICVLDFDQHGARFEAMSKRQGEERDVTYVDGDAALYRRRWNAAEVNYTDQDYKFVIIVSPPHLYDYITRFVDNHFVGEPMAVLPFVSTGTPDPAVIPLHFADPTPIVAVSYPNAGANRFIPVFSALMRLLSIDQVPFVLPNSNRRYIRRHKASKPVDGTFYDGYFRNLIDNLDDYSWVELHAPVSSHFLASLADTKIVHLCRDPRDIMTSSSLRGIYDSVGRDTTVTEVVKEKAFRGFLAGGEYMHPQQDYFGQTMSFAEIAESFRAIQDYDNIYGLRFEDIRYHPREAYRDLLAWLGLDKIDLAPISDPVLDSVIELGTFAHQSGGKYVEGKEDAVSIFNDGGPAINLSLRKGIKGDWKNHFSPGIVAEVKRVAGDHIVAMGYEQDMNW